MGKQENSNTDIAVRLSDFHRRGNLSGWGELQQSVCVKQQLSGEGHIIARRLTRNAQRDLCLDGWSERA